MSLLEITNYRINSRDSDNISALMLGSFWNSSSTTDLASIALVPRGIISKARRVRITYVDV
jgi:hypothetical protein